MIDTRGIALCNRRHEVAERNRKAQEYIDRHDWLDAANAVLERVIYGGIVAFCVVALAIMVASVV